jgi:hypothetical protein
MYDDNTIDFDLDNRRTRSIQILKENEKRCTVHVSDFIESNRVKPLFFTHNHPTNILMVELANRILSCIGLETLVYSVAGWCTGLHLDALGFCHFPWNKVESTRLHSILHLDKYSVRNQVRCLHENRGMEDFYIVSDDMTKKLIQEHLGTVSQTA